MAELKEEDLEPEAPKPSGEISEDQLEPEPSTFDKIKEGAGAAAQGGLQGITFGFGDELKGLVGALTGQYNAKDRGASFVDDYRTVRDEARRDRAHAEEQHPYLYNGALIGSALLTPGASAKTAGGFLKSAAIGGGAFGLGSSEADVTKGDVLGAVKDTGVGAGLGLAGGMALKGGAALAQKGAAKLSGVAQRATAKGEAAAVEHIDDAINSARGSLGGEVSAGNRGIEVLRARATDPSLSEEARKAAQELLASPEIQALQESVAKNTIDQLGGRLGRIENAKTAMKEALEKGTPEARQAAIEAYWERSPLKRASFEIGKRILPTLAGSALGGAMGGTTGAGVGGFLGTVAGAASGAPGRIIKNAIWSPQTQRAAAETGASVLNKLAPASKAGVIAGEEAGNSSSVTRSALDPYLKLLRAAESEQ